MNYLGFTLTDKGVLPGMDKTRAIRDFPPPATVKQVRMFVGLCNYFRQSVPNFSLISQHLTGLIKQDSGWKEGKLPEKALEAFQKLKQCLIDPPILSYPDLEYSLLVDAAMGSENIPGGLGACLVQTDNMGRPKPIAYASRGLSKHERNYSAYLLELTAACFGITHFDVYLRNRSFVLYTDHKPLEKLSKVHTRTLNRLQQLMLEYNFRICYTPGKENTVPDFLSRNVISAVDLSYNNLVLAQKNDALISKLTDGINGKDLSEREGTLFRNLRRKLKMINGILYYTGRQRRAIFTPISMQADILQSAHNSLAGGHMGLFKTRERILCLYYWPSMDNDIKEHIKHCDVCQTIRPYNHPHKAPLQPLAQPSNPNHRIHIDLFGPLITSERNKKYVMVITDAFTKYVELVAIENKEAKTVADAIYVTWITRYSTPAEIVTDQGKEFCNSLTDEIFKQLGILHKTTSPYHPQTNASAEVFNRTMRRYLQSCLSPPYLDWEAYLPALRISYNTSVCKATQASPFSLIFGIDPNMPFFELEKYITYNETGELDQLTRLHQARKIANDANLEYKRTYKAYFDKVNKVGLQPLSIGDDVYLQVKSQQKYKNAKLQPLYAGPYRIIDIRDVNVTLLRNNKPYKVHINHVKPAHSRDIKVDFSFKNETTGSGFAKEPEEPATYPDLPEMPAQKLPNPFLQLASPRPKSPIDDDPHDLVDETEEDANLKELSLHLDDMTTMSLPPDTTFPETPGKSLLLSSETESSPSSSPVHTRYVPLQSHDVTMQDLQTPKPTLKPQETGARPRQPISFPAVSEDSSALHRGLRLLKDKVQPHKRKEITPPKDQPASKKSELPSKTTTLAKELTKPRPTRSSKPNIDDVPLPARAPEYKQYKKREAKPQSDK